MDELTVKQMNSVTVISLQGKIDSTNAQTVERQLNEAIAAYKPTELVLDLEKLNYISSIGLRIILRLRKANGTLKLTNVSSEIYDVFEMTGFTEMMEIQKAFRKVSVAGCTLIGKGAKSSVFRLNEDSIVKVYTDTDSLPTILKEQELSRRAFILGVPTAMSYDIVEITDYTEEGLHYGSVFELLDAKTYSQLITEHPDKLREYVTDFTELLKSIHAIRVSSEGIPSGKTVLYRWLKECSSHLSAEDNRKLQMLADSLADSDSLLHGDYHTNNIMLHEGESLIIDMASLCHGHPVLDLANVHITFVGFGAYARKTVEDFLALPYETAQQIWEYFLPAYLGTNDPARIDEVNDKVQLLSYARLLQHLSRRNARTPEALNTIRCSADRIHELLQKVDRLDF